MLNRLFVDNLRNPKSEIQNPKQILITKSQNYIHKWNVAPGNCLESWLY